jgi:hypothetical protein
MERKCGEGGGARGENNREKCILPFTVGREVYTGVSDR